MWPGSEDPFNGKYYQLGRTLNSPQSLARPHPYLMIGGSGEKETLRLVAQYADACNIFAGPEAARKRDALRAPARRTVRRLTHRVIELSFGYDSLFSRLSLCVQGLIGQVSYLEPLGRVS
jgi:alkanesulfonate monooxygenase SsuD/methylene tetrahydromethanopterin reductase-like flavin-dependent oxidoreductase (luciferase family)